MTFLTNYLVRHGIRIIDFYRLIDSKQSGLMSRADFVAGVLQQKIPLNSNDLEIILNYVDQDHTDQISFQMFSSRLYLYRISVRDQLRVRAHEFSKHQLDQHRMFIQPTGSKDIDKPPQGFPSKGFGRQVQSKVQPRSTERNKSLRHSRTSGNRIQPKQTETRSIREQPLSGDTFEIACSSNDAYNVSKSRKTVASIDPLSYLQDRSTEDHHINDQFIPVPILQVYDRSYFEQTGAQ
ncbi:hypothetical protein P879_07584 [Paragonimus westermani]|uniref:EF-hand domain-containing protein n=1 Tax=Paragonimus westermani TaxID=34504 RepID=A0A8T0DDB9_9TREM|nr:hypothetical protein P879_07584 [Paragonimus westermani]